MSSNQHTTETTTELFSLAQLAAMTQRSPSAIRAAFERLGLPCAYTVNGVDHWDAGQVEALFEHFRATEGSE